MRIRTTFLILLLLLIFTPDIEGKKIKTSLKVEKNTNSGKFSSADFMEGREIMVADTCATGREDAGLRQEMRKCSFAGYEKEANSNRESFIVINDSENLITGFKVRIDYLDMQGRMLHSRELKEKCFVPAGENRKIDVGSWDKQKTYYYYLGNAPKKIATPYQVSFTPLSLWIEEKD